MCGINGILRLEPGGAPVDRDELVRTRDSMTPRGPDDSGAWIADDCSVGLGHRRLSIIDLSAAGHQPMEHDGGRYRIVFNGEIYNYRELRQELATRGVVFRTQSDTEVILTLYATQGPRMLPRLRGMYALAIWDSEERSLFLARDPYGIKPLYYKVTNGTLRFASQVKALQAAAGETLEPAGLVGFLLWGSVPEPLTLWSGIRAVPAGHSVLVRGERLGDPEPHYRFDATPPSAQLSPLEAFEGSVRAHLVADVPVGLFLSAGLDSSLIAALAQRNLDEPMTTLTLKFDSYEGTEMDEAPLAAEVARTLGTRHVERRVQRSDFLDLWPTALAAMDQPSIDGFNTFVVSRAAHDEGFKVVLSGLGGDELLGSYDSFADVPRWSRWAGRLGLVPGLSAVWHGLAGKVMPDKPKLAGLLEFGRRLAGSYFLRRALFLPHELPPLVGEDCTRAGLAAYDPVGDAGKFLAGSGGGAWEAVHRMESTQYMRNQLLRDSDWASMAHSLELRVPLVDRRLRDAMVEAGFEPARSEGKAALVRRVAPELPRQLWTRPKTGFSIPVMEWLDEEIGLESSRGLASRRLALKVLDGFGIELGREARRAGIA